MNNKFEVYKLKREIKRSGQTYEVFRFGKNQFGEPDKEATSIGFIRGLYHEENGYVTFNSDGETRTRHIKNPMIMVVFEDAEFIGIKANDFVFINGKKFNVNHFLNILEWGLVADISLELVDDGVK